MRFEGDVVRGAAVVAVVEGPEAVVAAVEVTDWDIVGGVDFPSELCTGFSEEGVDEGLAVGCSWSELLAPAPGRFGEHG